MANELHAAAADPINGYERVRQLIEQDHVDVNALHSEHDTPAVAFAAQSGSLETLDYLVKHANANVDARSQLHNLLFWAEANPDPAVLTYVANPANGLVARFNDGTTPLHVAVYEKKPEEITGLLSTNPQLVVVADNKGRTPLFFSASYGQASTTHAITSNPAFIALNNPNKFDPMFRGQVDYFHRQARSLYGTVESINAAQEAINSQLALHQKEDDTYHDQLGQQYLLLGQCYIELIASRAEYKRTYSSLGIRAIEEAIRQFERVPEKSSHIHAQLATCYSERAHVAYEAGKYSEAVAILTTGLRYATQRTDSLRIQQIDEINETINRLICRQTLEQQANKWGFSSIDVVADGSCFFHAAHLQLEHFNDASLNQKPLALRLETVRHMQQYTDAYQGFMETSAEEYFRNMSDTRTWADHLTIQAFSRQFNVNIVIISDNEEALPTIIKQANPVTTLYFGFMQNNHYLALQPKTEMLRESLSPLIEAHETDSSNPGTKRAAEDVLSESPPTRRHKSSQEEERRSVSPPPQAFFTQTLAAAAAPTTTSTEVVTSAPH